MKGKEGKGREKRKSLVREISTLPPFLLFIYILNRSRERKRNIRGKGGGGREKGWEGRGENV